MGIIAKQSIRGTAVTYIGVLVGFLTTFVVLTRFLTTEEIGLARVLIDAATLFMGLAQMGTSSSIIRYYPYFRDEEHHDHGFWIWTLLIPFVGFLLFTGVYILAYVPLSHWFSEKSPLFVNYYYAVIPMGVCMLYQTVFETGSNVKMRIVVPKAVRELIVRIGLLICYLLYAFRLLSIDGFVVALCVNYGVAALINLLYFVHSHHVSWHIDRAFLRENSPLIRDYGLYTLFLIVSTMTGVLAPTLSSFFITAQMGLESTGIFAIATYIAVMVSIPYRSLTAIAAPQLAANIKDNQPGQAQILLGQVATNTLLVGMLLFVTIWVNIDLIFHILPNGDQYADAKDVVFILGLSQLILASFSFCLSALNYSRYYVYSLLFSFILTLSAILLNNHLIPLYGMSGAAMSNLLSYSLYFLLIVYTTYRTSHIHPFSKNMLWTVLILIAVLVLNSLWLTYMPTMNLWVDSILRSLILIGGAVGLAYRLRLSPEIYALLHSLFV